MTEGTRSSNPPDPAAFAKRLADVGLDLREKAAVVAEVREMIEVFVNVDYTQFLSTVLPVQMSLLESTPCAFVSDAPEQKLRHALIETIYRYPQHEAVRPHAERLMQTMLKAVQEDNEENATVAFKVIIDLHRSFKSVLQSQVQPFLELVQKLYLHMRTAVAEAFGTERTPGKAPAVPPSSGEQSGEMLSLNETSGDVSQSPAAPRPLLKSSASFKVLTECPIAIVLIFQTYRNVVNSSINVFVPLIFEHCLMLQALPQQQAHEAAHARGEIFLGVAPGIQNRQLFNDMVTAQVKTMSFLAYVLRGSAPIVRQYAQLLPEVNVRLLKDCPPENAVTRKELLVATRHILSTDFRENFVGQIDTLLDERVLLGSGVTARELQRPLVVSMLADLMHHVRQELTTDQIVRVINLHAQLLHDPTLAPSIQTMCVKLLLNLMETIVVKHADRCVPMLRGIFQTFLAKLPELHRLGQDLQAMQRQGLVGGANNEGVTNQEQAAANRARIAHASTATTSELLDDSPSKIQADRSTMEAVRIEQAKATQSAVSVLENVPDPLKNARFLFRNLLFGFKTLITVLKHRGVPEPDGEVMGRAFLGGVKCCLLQTQRDGREEKDIIDLFTNVFIDLQPETFHEVFSTHLPFLFEEILHAPVLLGIPQNLLSNDAVSRIFVEILLNFLVARLEDLGTDDKKHASVLLRLFKMAFMAVTIFPEENEAVLQPHLTHLIMQSLTYASKAEEPMNYFLLLRALFRSIGGGRFELLYKDVLPLLPVLLEKLNLLLDAAEPSKRELFVDLCLTVPVRLSVLLPYLDQLMHPLVLALQSSPNLVSQGLRTLELCIDNLTQEFLDPIMAPYVEEIMTALWKHLKPLPHNHQHSHTTMRILGKLGGRNRRFLQNLPHLHYHAPWSPSVSLMINGSKQTLSLMPAIEMALGDSQLHRESFVVLRGAAALLMKEGAVDADHRPVLRRVLVGLFRLTSIAELQQEVREYLLSAYDYAMRVEIHREVFPMRQGAGQRHLLPSTLVVLDAMAYAVDGVDLKSAAPHIDLLLLVVQRILAACEAAASTTRPALGTTIVHALASSFCSLCYEKHWHRRLGGWLGIDTLVRRAHLGPLWIADHQLEIVRALLFMLKDMPSDPPKEIAKISDTLYFVLQQAYKDVPKSDANPSAESATQSQESSSNANLDTRLRSPRERPSHLSLLVGILIPELSCANQIARSTTQNALELLAKLKECSVTNLLSPQRDRLLMPIFTKPLRALPFGMQIGHIDAITYTLQLQPPLPSFNEELFRVLTEALALADADDQALMGRTTLYKNLVAVKQLRVAALRLLASAMQCTAFMAPEHVSMRMRIISVYFKCLYSQSEEVVQVAYDSLKATLAQQSKLPKDLLRSGLQPILMTLADRNRLTTAGLDGLARLLQLLTNYFKVEIGIKLLDHLTSLAEPSMLRRAAPGSLDNHEQLRTLAAIVRVFHLLPDTAYQFMPRLPMYVAEIELHMKRVGPTPFTEMLVLYLNRFASHAIQFFFDGDRVCNARLFRLLKLAIASKEGGALRSELSEHCDQYILPLFADPSNLVKITAGLNLVQELVQHDPAWLSNHSEVTSRVLALWNSSEMHAQRRAEADVLYAQSETTFLFLDLFYAVLRQEPHLEMYLAMLDMYTFHPIRDLTPITRFIYQHVCVNGSLDFKRELIKHAAHWLCDSDGNNSLKIQMLRVIVNPILVASYPDCETDSESDSGQDPLLNAELITVVANKVWKPAQNAANAELFADDALKIELLQMSTHFLKHGADIIKNQGAMKLDAIKFGWASLSAEDVIVKHCAYAFIARFLHQFDSPLKIIGQVYIGLLRLHQSDGRALVRKALDVLVPALPQRVPSKAGQTALWVKWTKRTLLDEGHNAMQLSAILHLILRYEHLFYASREMFLPHIVSSLAKLGLASSASGESKKLVMELVQLLFRWEARAEDTMSSIESPRKRQRTSSSRHSEVNTPSSAEYSMPMHLRDVVVGFLVRFVSMSVEPYARNDLTCDAFHLLEQTATLPAWKSVQVRLAILQRALIHTEFTEPHFASIANALATLDVISRERSSTWYQTHMAQLHKLLEKTLMSDKPALLDAARPILQRMFAVLPAAPPSESSVGSADSTPNKTQASQKPSDTSNATPGADDGTAFCAYAENIIQEAFKSMSNLYSLLTLLSAWSQDRWNVLDRYLPMLIKLLTRFTKEHLGSSQLSHSQSITQANGSSTPTPTTNHASQRAQSATPTAPGLNATPNVRSTPTPTGNTTQSTKSQDATPKHLLLVLNLVKQRISHLGDQRRWFLSAVVQLVEKSPSNEVAQFLLQMMRTWVLDSNEAFPTVKEKAGIMMKMLCFEQRKDSSLFQTYLQLILDIYKTPALARSELTARLESAFLLGCRNSDKRMREEFLSIFDKTLTKSVSGRVLHLLGYQSWECIAEHYFLHQILDLLIPALDGNQPLVPASNSGQESDEVHDSFTNQLHNATVLPILDAVRALQYNDVHGAHALWLVLFPSIWRATPKRHQVDITRGLIGCMTRDYMMRQASQRPNVVQSLLEGALACTPAIELPPHVVKYLGKTFQVWYTAMELLQDQLTSLRSDDAVRESTQDALAELYAELSESDYFYGLWRRRCVFPETNAALAYEQNGMYAEAQVLYEAAQAKGRSSGLPLTEAEYNIWDDHWVLSALELQQWDILSDLAKLEGNEDLSLECAWRLADWTADRESLERSVDSLNNTSTPRRKVFEAYLSLLKSQTQPDKPSEFGRICDEAIQLTLYKWYTLPSHVSQAHVPLLEIFQQFVELQEVSTVFASLAHTNATNLNHRSAELKTLMQTWRERLPNLWDDINAWSDLVAWRQHVFSSVNKAYLPLVPLIQRTEGPGSSTNSYAYRGYHETAWIINRFAHVARKHGLDDVCVSSLTKIYTLPNIEIQEAFLKLREQARCHYHNPNELMQGLNVINNTNLMFFAAAQKAEFFSLRGMFLNKLGMGDEANQAFATAIQMDLNLPKSWTEWGRFSDRLFREKPTAMHLAANAISCYLQAAGLYKNAKSRKILLRVLWLLSCDDGQRTLWQACDNFHGETPVWYWITFIPQLLQFLSVKEASFVRKLLMQIAKSFPQSLYYSLRTAKEDYVLAKRNSLVAQQRAAARQSKSSSGQSRDETHPQSSTPDTKPTPMSTAAQDSSSTPSATQESSQQSSIQPAQATPSAPQAASSATGNSEPLPASPSKDASQATDFSSDPTTSAKPEDNKNGQRTPWEHVDEVLNILKTAFPLLALTMENMADQLQQRFKPSNDEDIYRLTNALLNDALQQYIHRAPLTTDNGQLPQTSQMNVKLFADNLPPGPLKTAFENDFVRSKPTLREYVVRLQRWRDRYEESLDRRPKRQHLEHCSHYLVEFQHQKFDEVEIPGQYLQLADNNANFERISRFLPEYDLLRSNGMCNRRITILSNKGSLYSFAVQLPSARYCRREERIFQLLRLLNTILDRKIETRKRGLSFNVPTAVPISPQLRLLSYDEAFISMQDIYERHCKEIGIGKDDPIVAWVEKMRSTWDGGSHSRTNVDFANLRMELMEEISVKMISDQVLSTYLMRTMVSAEDIWLMRKQFTLQMATTMFLTYILFISARFPSRIHINRSTGAVVMSDVVPTFSPTAPHFKSPDPTPFRLSPNIQHMIGAIGIEGIVTSSFTALGSALALSEHGLQDYLGIFVRDELQFWFSGVQRQVPKNVEPSIELVMQNVSEVVKRARLMSCRYNQEKSSTVPVNQTVLDLINYASHPSKLALQDPTWIPWL
ncbi:transcription-associated protein 1 [Malassezia yamatoensis]|uniref:Transcription-associated protein 1 n=1 Tax=Malassezia yamatoensis TaxID=253288 RepID=A0AAJ5YPJ6_9BASI|nr:transcription-associated protein 1 [Malassezia yamatoensis]